jgi:hypothetical protein
MCCQATCAASYTERCCGIMQRVSGWGDRGDSTCSGSWDGALHTHNLYAATGAQRPAYACCHGRCKVARHAHMHVTTDHRPRGAVQLSACCTSYSGVACWPCHCTCHKLASAACASRSWPCDILYKLLPAAPTSSLPSVNLNLLEPSYTLPGAGGRGQEAGATGSDHRHGIDHTMRAAALGCSHIASVPIVGLSTCNSFMMQMDHGINIALRASSHRAGGSRITGQPPLLPEHARAQKQCGIPQSLGAQSSMWCAFQAHMPAQAFEHLQHHVRQVPAVTQIQCTWQPPPVVTARAV